MYTFGSFFSGFGLVDIGAKQAGLRLVFGIEYDDKIAGVYRRNLGDHIIVSDLLNIDVKQLPCVNFFHASPPCPNFSIANPSATESRTDIMLSRKVSDYIDYHKPNIVTIENVYKYRLSKSWGRIKLALEKNGYSFYDMRNVNMADHGVPQSRRRMIVRAVRGKFTPSLPPAQEHIGWYQAIEDLIPQLEDDNFAEWQLRLLDNMEFDFLVGCGTYSKPVPRNRPSHTVTANSNQTGIRAFLPNGDRQNSGKSFPVRASNEPAHTILSSSSRAAGIKAFLLNGTPNQGGQSVTIRTQDEPVFTITATQEKRVLRAALERGRVVRLSTRCLARLQTIPDWYELPENNSLACRGIGNGLPVEFSRIMYKQLINYLV